MQFYNNVGEFLLSGIAIVISFTIHEYSHALASHIQGDDTPERYGRLTLNPLSHVDIVGLVALFLFSFGWAKPVPISSRDYKHERLGVIITSFAGPFSNMLLAFTASIVILAVPASDAVQYFLGKLIVINCGLAVFNLLPFPPLDGSKIIAELFGGFIADMIYKIERAGIMILFLILWIPEVSNLLGLTIHGLVEKILTLASIIVGR